MRRSTAVTLLAATVAFAGGLSFVVGGLGNVGLTGVACSGECEAEAAANPHFFADLAAGATHDALACALSSQIDLSPDFQSSCPVAHPNGLAGPWFSALKQSGEELDRLSVCGTDPTIDNVAVSFVGGKQAALLRRVTTMAMNGNYRLVIDVWDGTDYDQTFNTAVAPNNTAAGLNNSIQTSLSAAGFTTFVSGSNLVVQRQGTMLVTARISSTDTGVVDFCVEMTATPPSPIPTLSQVGMFVLVLLLTGAAILVLRRRRVPSAA